MMKRVINHGELLLMVALLGIGLLLVVLGLGLLLLVLVVGGILQVLGLGRIMLGLWGIFLGL